MQQNILQNVIWGERKYLLGNLINNNYIYNESIKKNMMDYK